jgi:hypothetical protein
MNESDMNTFILKFFGVAIGLILFIICIFFAMSSL